MNDSNTAARGMVTGTTGAGAIEAGVEILKQGGSAADAVAATALTQVCMAAGSWVSYAGIFTMVYFDAAERKTHNLNAAFNTVQGETDALSIPGVNTASLGKGFSAWECTPSGRTALVPGFMAGIEATHARFGKLSLEQVFAPAIRIATDGFEWPQGNAQQYAFREKILNRLPETRAIFAKSGGGTYAAGDLFKQPALAETLKRTVKEGIRNYLYEGEWASKLVAAVQADGGHMTLKDLADYRVHWAEPVHGTYHGYDVYSHGLPATGGVNLIEALNLAEIAGLSRMGKYSDSPKSLYWLAQIAKLAFEMMPGATDSPESAAAIRALGLNLSLESRLRKDTSVALWQAIESGRFPKIKPPQSAAPAHSDSIVAIDKWGNIAAVVHSINAVSWGSTGIFVDGISIPDSASFQQAAIAATQPGARLADPTNPGLIVKDGQPYMGFGSIGSGLHIRTLACLLNVLDFGMTPQQAIDSPSLGSFTFDEASKLTVGVNEFPTDFLQAVGQLGQEVIEDNPMRGYWLGIQLDPKTQQLNGGAIRELNLGGRAVGY
jgi:gamma-glutamyltranspeptidase / glutathione hydrolase